METKSFAQPLKSFLLKRYGEEIGSVSQFLPKQLREEVLSIKASPQDPASFLLDPEELIRGVHISWLEKYLSTVEESWRVIFFSLLPITKQKALARGMQSPIHPIPLSSFARASFTRRFFDQWDSLPTCPKSALPHGFALDLLEQPTKVLVELVDYLGIYDLSRELHTVVDGQLLRRVLDTFSHPKREFLKKQMRQRPRILASPFGIVRWDGDQTKLLNFTHFRGLVWLSRSLSIQDENYWWYLTHKLDRGRASVLVKAKKKASGEEAEKLSEPVAKLYQQLVS